MAREHFDVAVLGSGWSGSILAVVLARQGFRVLLLDEGAPPRFGMGEALPLQAALRLWLLGERFAAPELLDLASPERLIERAVATSGVRRSVGFLYHQPGRLQDPAQGHRVVPPVLPFAAGSHFFRPDVDGYLREAAARQGATVRGNASLTRLEIGGERVTLGLACGEEIAARFVVDACGASSPVAELLDLDRSPAAARARTRTLGCCVRGLRPYDELLADAGDPEGEQAWHEGTLLHVFDGGWLRVLPFDNHGGSINPLACVSLTLDLRWAGSMERPPSEEVASWLARFPSLAAHFAAAAPVGPWTATGRRPSEALACCGDRYFLLPESCGGSETLFGRDLIRTCEALHAFLPRLIGGLEENELGGERFADLEGWWRRCREEDDSLIAGGLRALAHFSTWDAWVRLWLAEASSSVLGLLGTCGRYRATGEDCSCETSLTAGAAGAHGREIVALRCCGERLFDRVDRGELTPEGAAEALLAGLAGLPAAQNEKGRFGLPKRPPSRTVSEASADLDDVLGRGAFLALDDVELHPITLGERPETFALDRRVVDEAVLATVLQGDEAEALGVVEPLHSSGATHKQTSFLWVSPQITKGT
jgi:FADH2 O2-dependent halogenase